MTYVDRFLEWFKFIAIAMLLGLIMGYVQALVGVFLFGVFDPGTGPWATVQLSASVFVLLETAHVLALSVVYFLKKDRPQKFKFLAGYTLVFAIYFCAMEVLGIPLILTGPSNAMWMVQLSPFYLAAIFLLFYRKSKPD
jgi:hypothetical protein